MTAKSKSQKLSPFIKMAEIHRDTLFLISEVIYVMQICQNFITAFDLKNIWVWFKYSNTLVKTGRVTFTSVRLILKHN